MNPETPRSASPLSPNLWRPKRKKNYPHFDDHLNEREIDSLVKNVSRVRENPFLPFIVFKKKYYRFGKDAPRKEREKSRELRYAARKDAYIYEYYRQQLSLRYEEELKRRNLSDVIIAYRKLKTREGRGKCSIDFARDAFAEIAARGNCTALALDVSAYFESIDHQEIKKQWCMLLNVSELPDDHYAVFRAVTRYSQIARDDVYTRLGYMKQDPVTSRWKQAKKEDIPTRLCSMQDLRTKLSPIIWTNRERFGIPQGSPISDLIANFYLIDFDERMSTFARNIGAYYRRYSDDILFIFSDSSKSWQSIERHICSEIARCGPQLKMKPEKTCVHQFSEMHPMCKSLKGDKRRFEYLGFQFDGLQARFRDRTTSNFYRKLKWAIYGEARRLVRKHPGKPAAFIESKFDISGLLQRFGRKKGFSGCGDVRNWTFWTYVNRSSKIMGPLGPNLRRQIKNYKNFVRYHTPQAIEKALLNRTVRRT